MEQPPKPAEAPKPKNRNMMLAVIIIVILVVVGIGVYILTRPPTSTGCTTTTTLTCITLNDDGVCATNATSCAFSPSNVTISVNSMVTWTNNGAVQHTVYACSNTNNAVSAQCPTMDASSLPSFYSPTLTVHGGAYSYTFSQAGHYYVYCSIHAWMHAEIIVQ